MRKHWVIGHIWFSPDTIRRCPVLVNNYITDRESSGWSASKESITYLRTGENFITFHYRKEGEHIFPFINQIVLWLDAGPEGSFKRLFNEETVYYDFVEYIQYADKVGISSGEVKDGESSLNKSVALPATPKNLYLAGFTGLILNLATPLARRLVREKLSKAGVNEDDIEKAYRYFQEHYEGFTPTWELTEDAVKKI